MDNLDIIGCNQFLPSEGARAMVVSGVTAVKPHAGRLSYHDLDGLADSVRRARREQTIIVDLSRAEETTTAALARLVVIRGRLKRAGGDLHLAHLHGRAKGLYEINRLSKLLPCKPAEEPACSVEAAG